MQILALCGSLRKRSYNLALLRAAAEVAPSGVNVVIHPLHDLPMYNPDDEDAPPAAVPAFLSALDASAGVLFGNPEYSHAYSGALKNALDWANEPDKLVGKRVTAVSAAPSQGGGVRGQLALREVLFAMGAHVFVHYELLVRGAKGKFDQGGRLTDADTREQLTKFMAEFATFVGS